MSRTHVGRPERHEPAATDVVAERHGPEQFLPGSIVALADGERRGNNGTARMRLCHRIGIVGLVGVGEHRVRQRGVYGGASGWLW